MENREQIHKDTLAINMILHGINYVRETAEKLNKVYDSQFIATVCIAEDTDEHKHKCLHLYNHERFKSS
jgi:hypothetical protein